MRTFYICPNQFPSDALHRHPLTDKRYETWEEAEAAAQQLAELSGQEVVVEVQSNEGNWFGEWDTEREVRV